MFSHLLPAHPNITVRLQSIEVSAIVISKGKIAIK